MASQAIEKYRVNAEIYTDPVLCKQKSLQVLEEISMPKGLLPLDDIIEVGYNREAGFIWLKRKKSKNHFFRRVGKNVSYAPEITAFVENGRMKKVTGVKSKEFLMWVSLSDIYIEDSSSSSSYSSSNDDYDDNKMITFKIPVGISQSFPVSAFELEEEDEKKN